MARNRPRDRKRRHFRTELGSTRLLIIVIIVSLVAGVATWCAFPGQDFNDDRYCAKCDDVFPRDECVTGGSYWECRGCSVSARSAGACPGCEQKMKPRSTKGLACPTCFGRTTDLDED